MEIWQRLRTKRMHWQNAQIKGFAIEAVVNVVVSRLFLVLLVKNVCSAFCSFAFVLDNKFLFIVHTSGLSKALLGPWSLSFYDRARACI